MPPGIKEEILGFYIAMGDALAVKISNPIEHLFETALHFARGHSTLFDGSIEVTARTEFHHLAPMLIFVFDEVDGFNNIGVVKSGRYTELCGEFLNVLLFCLILAPLAKLLQEVR